MNLALEKIGNEICEFGTFKKWKVGAKKVLHFISANKFGKNSFEQSKTQKFIGRQFSKTVEFLNENKNIIISQADKGGKVVIMDRNMYNSKMEKYLKECTKDHTYFKCERLSVNDVSNYVEEKYGQLRLLINQFLLNDARQGFPNLCYPLTFEPYVIPRMYGNIKVHKDNFPIRPIISSVNCLGGPLMEWLLNKLEIVAERLSECKIINSIQVFNKLNGVHLDDDHELVTWDYDNMYTNIPISVAKSIIRQNYSLIESVTSVPVDVFIEAISFFTEHSNYFLHHTGVYRQSKGLAMGNCLSKVLAEIVTRSSINEAVKKFSSDDIRFLGIYVDDIFGVMNKKIINEMESDILKGQKFLKLKIVRENELNEVDFLNVTVKRTMVMDNKFKLTFKWFTKECSAGRILDFQSSHPLSMKKSICEEFIKNTLTVSDKEYWNEVEEKLCSIFKMSNYPGRYVKSRFFNVKKRMNNPVNFVKDQNKNKNKINRVYISFPYDDGILKRSKRLLRSLNIKTGIHLSPRIMSGMRQKIFSKLKCGLSSRSIINATAVIHCSSCKFTCKVAATCYDLQRSVQKLKNDEDSLVAKHIKKFPNHSMKDSLRGIKTYRSRYDMKCSLNGSLSV